MTDLDLTREPGHDPAGAQRTHRRSRRRLSGCIPVALALVVVLALVAVVGVVVWKGAGGLRDLFADPTDFAGNGNGNGKVTVEVAEGELASDIAKTLEQKGVVASTEAFTDEAARNSDSLGIQPGFYQLREQMSARSALDLLVSGETRIENEVTIPEGLTAEETFAELADQTKVSEQAYRAAARRAEALGLPVYADGELEGYLFPATYPLPPGLGAGRVLELMLDRFRQAATAVGLAERAVEVDRTPAEVVTVASLIQAESRRPADFAKVAAVIYNRLDERIKLDLDSTVQYATGGTGVFTTDKERADPSPYNTYTNAGLPPGPVGAPGELALEAALDPAEGRWTFFVTVNLETGRTLFTPSYSQHLRNVKKLFAYCRSSGAC